MFAGMFVFFTKYKVNNSDGNNSQKESNLSLSYGGSKIDHNSSVNSSALTAMYHAIIAPTRFSVNTSRFLVTNIAASQITTKFEHMVDKTFSCALFIYIQNIKHSNVIQYV